MAQETQTYEHILVERRADGVALVTLNRPQKLNAFAQQTRAELAAALKELDQDDAVGAIVLTGAGERAFAAGQDLAEAQQFSPEHINTWIGQWGDVYDAILSLSKPIIAAVRGYAVGAGFQVALVCDIRIAGDDARFGMPEIDDAIPCITGTWSLYDIIGRSRTIDMITTGRMVGAEEALTWGLVSRVVPAASVVDEALQQAAVLAAKPRVAMTLNKQWWKKLLIDKFPASEAFAKQAHTKAYQSGEPQQAMANFLAKKRHGRST